MTTLAHEAFSGRHRATKGIAALAAAAALLLSGYGSYALWTDTESLDGGDINAGELKITDVTPGVWRDVSAGGAGTVIPDITSFLVVPGDVLTYTLDAKVLAKGDNLRATLTADPASVTGDLPLRNDITVSTAINVAGAPSAAITEANDGQTLQAVVTLDFDEASLNPSQLQNLDLSDLSLVLNQNAR